MTTPTLISIVLCDTVLRDALRPEKTTLYGLFNQIFSTTFPAVHAQMVVMVEVRDLDPKSKAVLLITPHASPDKPIFKAELPERPDGDETNMVGLQFAIQGLQFPAPGNYQVVFVVDGKRIGDRGLVATEIKPPETPGKAS